MAATSEAAIKEIVASLTETACAETARADAAERQLAILQNSLTEATLALEPLEAHKVSEVGEARDVLKALGLVAALEIDHHAYRDLELARRLPLEGAPRMRVRVWGEG